MKKCPKCGESKEPNMFHSDITRSDKKDRICKECSRIYRKIYDQTLKGRYVMYKKCARHRGYTFTLTMDDFIKFWNKDCHYCGDKIEGIGLDRINNSIGYEVSNVVPCCEICNYMKQSSSKKSFISQCKKIIRFQKCK